jgi:tetratricopeptide (TPR) repeat protein
MLFRFSHKLYHLLVIVLFSTACHTFSGLHPEKKVLSAQDFFEMGLNSAKQRNFVEAILYYDTAIIKDKSFSDAYFRRGLAKDNLGLTLDAIEDYTTAINIDPRPIYFNNRGINRAILGEYEAAVGDYNLAILLDECYGDALINRGYAFAELGRVDKACFDFKKALELNHLMAQRMIDHFCK